ncbi:pyrimidodiazepine synthase-like [Coccinella septempunctata]|uniref:pyrimidodiazepine synthase-like n=1 Tax=Coccinella septempunctata TaxID=41139 RepID=UPI001D090812|nr:pyrimidodiazepine synthase-like [Coccinella septempunctata]
METKTKHLTLGSPIPPKTEPLTLYSFEYCPFAQRVRLVLHAKGLKYQAVNINLKKKPEWYSSINTSEKVPALDIGDKIITESLDICNYLDKTYPTPALYSAEPEAAEKEKELIDKIGSVTSLFAKCMMNAKDKTPEEWVKDFLTTMEPFETELKLKGTKFFGGDNPGMVDYMLWPWAERAKVLDMLIGEKLPFSEDCIPTLHEWKKNMLMNTVVQAVYNGPEKCFKAIQLKYNTEDPDFDSI